MVVARSCQNLTRAGLRRPNATSARSSFAICGRDQLVGAVTVETWTSEQVNRGSLSWILYDIAPEQSFWTSICIYIFSAVSCKRVLSINLT